MKGMRELHEKRLALARNEYIKSRRPKPDTRAAELQAELDSKKRQRSLEDARRCYLRQREQAEALLKRGRSIPEMKEFDLEDY
ncbi:MAG: YeaH/YhbH family protein [Calothrix sp. SM1_5_4]|nr:YeaH/YhbH family protein [Calothrix sp. SM1_5_4]